MLVSKRLIYLYLTDSTHSVTVFTKSRKRLKVGTLLPPNACHTADGAWTTVMNWASYKPEEFEGESYGQKDVEFMQFRELPSRTRENSFSRWDRGLEKTVRQHTSSRSAGKSSSPISICLTMPATTTSFPIPAEWSIAKNGYVKSHSGWFSCRSACYLAAGKPVVIQDTGWSDHLPSGDRALCFTNLAEAVDAIEAVARDYTHHCTAARTYPRTYFDAAKVCAELLE